jgi:hypothetical protein
VNIKQKIVSIFFCIIFFVFFSCGSSETQSAQPMEEAMALQPEDTVMIKEDSISLIDSLIAQSVKKPQLTEDTTAIVLKAKLMADTFSAKISDSTKRQIKEAREYMKKKQNR